MDCLKPGLTILFNIVYSLRYSKRSSASSANHKCKICLLISALLVVGILSISFYSVSDTPTTKSIRESFIRSFPIGGIIALSKGSNSFNEGIPDIGDLGSISGEKGTIQESNSAKLVNSALQAFKNNGEEKEEEEADVIDTRSSKIRNKDVINRQYIHFIHIPKCGGTTMTIILRQMQCVRDPEKNKDCCTNPGLQKF